jgi:hypothetical protein
MTVIIPDPEPAAPVESGLAAGAALATAENASKDAEEAAVVAEEAADAADVAVEIAVSADETALDAAAEVAILRARLDAQDEELAALRATQAPLDAPEPEPVTVEVKVDDDKTKEPPKPKKEENSSSYGSKTWFGNK